MRLIRYEQRILKNTGNQTKTSGPTLDVVTDEVDKDIMKEERRNLTFILSNECKHKT